MGLLRTDIQNEINKAHVKIDELTTLMAKRYERSQSYSSIAKTIYKGINYIKVLENEENLTDQEVELFIQALRETLELHEVDYQPTTLQLVQNQPRVVVENTLTVSGTPGVLPRFNGGGDNFEDSTLLQLGNQLIHDGTSYQLGDSGTLGTTRLISTDGVESSISLTIRTSGNLSLQGNSVSTPNPLVLGQTLGFDGEATTIESIKDDSTFASPSTTALVTEAAIDSRIDNEVSVLNAAITSSTVSAGSGLTKTGSTMTLGGNVTSSATLALQTGQSLSVTSPLTTAGLAVSADTSFSLFGPTGGIEDTGSVLRINTAPLDYDADRSGSYTTRSVTDKNYQDTHVGGQLVTATVSSPTATEDGYSIVWDNALSRYTLQSISGGGGSVGDADTLDGLDSTQFLRSDAVDTATKKTTWDLSAETSSAGQIPWGVNISSDNSYARLDITRDGASNPTGIEFYSTDSAGFITVKGSQFESTIATGTAPLVVASTTKVTNLNADLVDGYNTSPSASADTIAVRDSSGRGVFTTLTGVTSTALVTNFNADQVDGLEGSDLARLDIANTFSQTQTFSDGVSLVFGAPAGLSVSHTGDTFMDMDTTNLRIRNNSSQNIARFTQSASELYYQGSLKLNTVAAGIEVTGSVVATGEGEFFATSDKRYKKEIRPMDDAISLSIIDALEPVSYKMKEGSGIRHHGFIAQDVERFAPSAVRYLSENDLYVLDKTELISYLVGAVKELKRLVDGLTGD